MKTQPKRNLGLDAAKSFAIFLVLLIHYIFYTGFVGNTLIANFFSVLTVIGVPLFFMVNGYLLLNSGYDPHKHWRRTAHILIVLTLWKVISLPLVSFLSNVNIDWRQAISFLLGAQYDIAPLGYFWFMNVLVAIYFLYPLLKISFDSPTGKKQLKLITLIIGFLIFGSRALTSILTMINFIWGTGLSSPFTGLESFNLFGQYGYALIFFLAGGFWKSLDENRTDRSAKTFFSKEVILSIIVFTGMWISLFIVQRLQNAHNPAVNFYVEDGYTSIITVFMTASAFQLFLLLRKVPKTVSSIIGLGGSTTLGIYYLHIVLILFAKEIITRAGIEPTLVVNIVTLVLIFICGIGITLISRKIPLLKYLFR